MDADEAGRGGLLGPAARPVLIAIIERLRPDLDPVAVGGAVEQIVLSGEEGHDLPRLWRDMEQAITELEHS